jgi:hypothetical protein
VRLTLGRMTTFSLVQWCEIAGLVLGGVLAAYYAKEAPSNRLRNTLVAAVLLGLAWVRISALGVL